MFDLVDNTEANPIIKVIGVGGGGCNAVKRMIGSDMPEVRFYAANTDMQALSNFDLNQTLQLGVELTQGLGAGANPDVGADAALESREKIQEIISGAHMVFIAAGMGGGTGTGAAPIIAEVAKEMGILTVSVVTKPFEHELGRRMAQAERGIAELAQHSDSLIVIPNAKLLKVLPKGVKVDEAFAEADNVLCGAVKGITDIIVKSGMMNVDFADVRTVMSEKGVAMMGTGIGQGENRAEFAANMAAKSPLLENTDFTNAKGVLVNITANKDSFGLQEMTDVCNVIQEMAGEDANVITGVVYDASYTDEMKVTVILTGLDSDIKGLMQPLPKFNPGKTFHQPTSPKKSYDNDISRLNVPKFLKK